MELQSIDSARYARAWHFAAAVVRGQRDRLKVLKAGAKNKIPPIV